MLREGLEASDWALGPGAAVLSRAKRDGVNGWVASRVEETMRRWHGVASPKNEGEMRR
jgi:hypothetical protein